MAFNYKEYFNDYNKKNYKKFCVSLRNDEYDKIDKALEEKGILKSEFLRNAINQFYEENNIE